ncbi:MAG: MBL fold metallo-hydrolase [Gemmatimonadota bacterium]
MLTKLEVKTNFTGSAGRTGRDRTARCLAMALAALASPGLAAAQEHPPPEACQAGPTLTYLANSAVLIRGAHTALIDAPFTDGVEPYPRLRAETLRRARSAEPPFDDLDWVLVSHDHADHGDARAIADLLEANRSVRLISTRAVVVRVRAEAGDASRLADRLVAVEPVEGEPIAVNDRAPRIEVLALHHGRRRAVTNLGFLVDMDGVRMLHVGDAEVTLPDIEPLGLSGRDIDVALMPTWYARSDRFRPVLDALEARRVLLMHFPERRAGDRLFRRSGGWEAFMRSIAESDPPMVPLIRRGRTYCLDPFTEIPVHARPTEP